ncbi:MAG: winged helix-turn-helix transcriptional regulator [Alphaproteobacteria bacterium]|nr:winged helix-turn-helix transcriptional regulator [Alphaproteobacteria bacterium]
MTEATTEISAKPEGGEVLDAEGEITLGLLSAVQGNSAVTQRSIAKELGIALGLANAYLRRCVEKGYIKVTQAPANRYLYYLTPQGFTEKSRLTASYLSHSFDFFRYARRQCEDALGHCAGRGWNRVVIYGDGELCEILSLCLREFDLEVKGVVAPGTNKKRIAGVETLQNVAEAEPFDAVILADLADPQASLNALLESVPAERVLTPPLLRIVRPENET